MSATLNLPAGKYVMFDFGGGDGPSASSRGAFAEFEVTAGQNGALPASSATITASTDEQGEPESSFEVSGGLKVGKNQVRLVTKGEQPHHAVLFPILPSCFRSCRARSSPTSSRRSCSRGGPPDRRQLTSRAP